MATIFDVTKQEWNKELVVPTDSLKLLQKVAEYSEIQTEVVDIGGEHICISPSTTFDGSWELFGDILCPWRITQPKKLISYLIFSNRAWLINGIDEPSSGNFGKLSLQVPKNLLFVGGEWEYWYEAREKNHKRKIRQNLQRAAELKTRIEGPDYVNTPEFSGLLWIQRKHLKATAWLKYDPICLDRMERLYAAFMQAILLTPELQPRLWVGSSEGGMDCAATITATINGCRFMISTLMNHGMPGVGAAVRSQVIKDSVEDSTVSCVDMMMGNSYFKRMYEPDLSYKTHLLAIYPTRFWEDPGTEVDLIPTPPFIADGKLYTLEPHELDLE